MKSLFSILSSQFLRFNKIKYVCVCIFILPQLALRAKSKLVDLLLLLLDYRICVSQQFAWLNEATQQDRRLTQEHSYAGLEADVDIAR